MILTPFAQDFRKNGFVIIRAFLDHETTQGLRAAVAHDPDMQYHSQGVLDATGRESKLVLWFQPGGDVFSRLSCSDEMHNQMAECLGEEVTFLHAKLMQKLPKVGGRWEWHQDYGYWYRDGFLKADMASCYVALDPATPENGCLQVIPESHTYGRFEHGAVGAQTGADHTRVEALLAQHGSVNVELAPGDAVFFHSNLLHMSGPNTSEYSRLGLISAFFTVSNKSLLADPRYQPKAYEKVPHSKILQVDPSALPRSDFMT